MRTARWTAPLPLAVRTWCGYSRPGAHDAVRSPTGGAHRGAGVRTTPRTCLPSVKGSRAGGEGEFSPRYAASRTHKATERAVANTAQGKRRQIRPWTRVDSPPDKGCAPGAAHLDKGCAPTAPTRRTVTLRVYITGAVRTAVRWPGVHCIVGARTGAHDAVHRAHLDAHHRVRAPDAGMSRTHFWRRRLRRADRHGFGRPPGYRRERRRTSGGFGDGYSAIRSRDASASCFRRSRSSGEMCGGIGSTMRASALEGVGPPHLRLSLPLPGRARRPRPGRCSGDFARRPARRSAPLARRTGWRTHGRPTEVSSVGRPGCGGGQLSSMAWRSLSVSSFVPRSAALLCVQATIAGCASS